MKGIIKITLLTIVLSVVMLSSYFVFAKSIDSTITANSFTVTWYDCRHGISSHSCYVDVQNLNSFVARDFNLSLLFNETNYEITKTTATIKEWKALPTQIPTYNTVLISQNCTRENFDNTSTETYDCSYNQTIQNGTVTQNIVQWKETKSLLTKTGANLKASYGNINIPKFNSKEKYDDKNNTETVNGTKRFLIEWSTPITSSNNGWGSSGLIAIIDETTGQIYHPWWDTAWLSRRNVTIINNVGANLTNFTVLVNTSFVTDMRANFTDVLFTDSACGSDTYQIPHELENYTASGNAYMWVMPSSLLTPNITICMYFNNSASGVQEKPVQAWNNDYVAVWHLDEQNSIWYDSTKSGNNLSQTGTIAITADGCRIGNCVRTSRTFSDYLNITAPVNIPIGNTSRSIELSFESFQNVRHALAGWGTGSTARYIYNVFSSSSDNIFAWLVHWGADDASNSQDLIDNVLFSIAWTYNGATTDLFYENGTNTYNKTLSAALETNTADPIRIGSATYSNQASNATIDEVRISNVTRSNAWLQASYQFLMNSSSLVSFGAIDNQFVNTAPRLRGLTILPNTAYVNDTLNISVVIDDTEGHSATANFTVRKNGLEAQNYSRTAVNGTNITFLSTFSFVHFDNVSVSAIANDSSVGGQFNTTNLTISDTTPAVRTVSLNLATAYVNDVLNASLIYTDIDADTGACTIEWHRNGAVANSLTRTALTNATNMTDLYDGTAFVHFDNISFKANCTANNLQSTAVSTTNLSISDSPPTVRTFSFNQSSYNVNGPVNLSLIPNDIDLDNTNISVKWFRNAVSIENQSYAAGLLVTNNTNVTFATTFSLTRYDNVSAQMNLTSNALSASFNTTNITIANTAPVINHVNVTVTGLDTATDIRLRVNVSDIDGATDIDVCSVLGVTAADSNDICNLNIGDALVNSSIIIWVNDTSAANTSRTIFISMSYAVRTNVLNENIAEGTTHNATIRYNLTVNGQNINETSIESSLPMGNMTNTTVNFFNRTGIFINTSTIQEVNATVLAVNETQTSTCVTVNLLGITRYTCRSYIDVRHQNVDLLNTSYTVSTSLLTSWADRFLNTEDAGVNNITANVSIAVDISQVNITILDAFALGNGSNEVGVIYDVPIIGEGGQPGGGGGGGSGFVQAVCGNFTYRPSDKITGYGIPSSDIAPFGIYIVNGNTQQGFTISLSKEVQQLCRVEPLSSEILKPNGAIKFTVTCSAPTEKTGGNFNIDSTIPGCSAAIPVELVPTSGVLFGLMEFVRLMAVGEIGSALMVNVFFLPIFLWFVVIAGIILVIWKI